ncbi:MAG: hypothetical protein WCR72_11140 [Bacteroidota bacterium]
MKKSFRLFMFMTGVVGMLSTSCIVPDNQVDKAKDDSLRDQKAATSVIDCTKMKANIPDNQLDKAVGDSIVNKRAEKRMQVKMQKKSK